MIGHIPALLIALITAYTGIDEKWAAALPEIIAETAGTKISRTDALALMRKTGGDQKLPPGDRQAVLKQVIDEELCRIVLRKKLSDSGIKADQANTLAFLQKSAGLRPPNLRPSAGELLIMADDKDVQLQTALHRYIAGYCPEKLIVSETEIEDFYRENQEIFHMPASVEAGILRLPKKEDTARQLRKAAARLKQGEDFLKVASMFPEAMPSHDIAPELLRKTARNLSAGEISGIVELPDSMMIMQFKSFTPESYLPLSLVREHIRQELAGQRAGKELAGEISRIRSQTPVIYHVQWLSE